MSGRLREARENRLLIYRECFALTPTLQEESLAVIDALLRKALPEEPAENNLLVKAGRRAAHEIVKLLKLN